MRLTSLAEWLCFTEQRISKCMGVNSLLHIMSTKDLPSENMGQVRSWIALFFPTENQTTIRTGPTALP